MWRMTFRFRRENPGLGYEYRERTALSCDLSERCFIHRMEKALGSGWQFVEKWPEGEA